MDFFSNEYTLLAMQRALLGEVTAELRAVFIYLDTDEQTLYARFYYDGEAPEKRIDLWDCAITEASAALGPDCFVKSRIERVDYPQKIPPIGYCAYLRKESNASSQKDCSFPRVKITEMTMGYALLAVQNVLLGVVTPELRVVIVDFEKEVPLLYIRFYYDGEVSHTLIHLWETAISEARADFGSSCLLDTAVERVDSPKPYPFRGRYAYERKE